MLTGRRGVVALLAVACVIESSQNMYSTGLTARTLTVALRLALPLRLAVPLRRRVALRRAAVPALLLIAPAVSLRRRVSLRRAAIPTLVVPSTVALAGRGPVPAAAAAAAIAAAVATALADVVDAAVAGAVALVGEAVRLLDRVPLRLLAVHVVEACAALAGIAMGAEVKEPLVSASLREGRA
jgi:hypothetical protein